MHVSELELSDFRSYPSASVQLEPGTTVFVGPNGHGKTNLVEAIGYVAQLASHRVSHDAPLVRSGAERAVVRCAINHDQRQLLVELEIVPGRANRARLNRSPVARPREILGALRTVLFAPEDLALVRGDPSERRRFIDQLLVARAPRLAGVRSDYERILKQRNALLKTAGLARRSNTSGELRTLDAWDTHLAEVGAQLLAGRLGALAELAPHVAKAYDVVSNSKQGASLQYQSSMVGWLSKEGAELAPLSELGSATDLLAAQLLSALANARSAEIERGVTLVGPHRDDLLLQLGELPAKGYASHGEGWSFALALRLASYELLRADGGEPVLILDDVFAELDAGRRERLAALVNRATQVIVTAAVPEDVPEVLSGARFDVAFGEVRRVR